MTCYLEENNLLGWLMPYNKPELANKQEQELKLSSREIDWGEKIKKV